MGMQCSMAERFDFGSEFTLTDPVHHKVVISLTSFELRKVKIYLHFLHLMPGLPKFQKMGIHSMTVFQFEWHSIPSNSPIDQLANAVIIKTSMTKLVSVIV